MLYLLHDNSLYYSRLFIVNILTLYWQVQTQKTRISWGGPILVHGKGRAQIKNESPKAKGMETGAPMH